jgi:hypothetical protein
MDLEERLAALEAETARGGRPAGDHDALVGMYEGDVWRASANHWSLVRTREGWRIAERFNRVLDGSEASHDVLRRVTS